MLLVLLYFDSPFDEGYLDNQFTIIDSLLGFWRFHTLGCFSTLGICCVMVYKLS